MRYWDSSALFATFLEEDGSDLCRGWMREDADVCTWAMTPVEITSAIERCVREGRLTLSQKRRLLEELDDCVVQWTECVEIEAVRAGARRLLARHALSGADAAQLAAAIHFSEISRAVLPFVTLDRALAVAASRESFPVLTWPEPRG